MGTLDLDVGLTVALLNEGRYKALTERLRRAKFVRDTNAGGHPTRQRWKIDGPEPITIDFLIQPTRPDDRGGRLRDIEPDFAAIIVPGLHLAFEDQQLVTLSGRTIMGETATRAVWVGGPGTYVVLKALAFAMRGENKDAYDLDYVVRNFGEGIEDVATRLRPLLADARTIEALGILTRDFLEHERSWATQSCRIPDRRARRQHPSRCRRRHCGVAAARGAMNAAKPQEHPEASRSRVGRTPRRFEESSDVT